MNTSFKIMSTLFFVGLGQLGCSAHPIPSNQPYVASKNIDSTHPQVRLILGSEDLLGEIALIDPKIRSVGTFKQAEVSVQNLSEDRYTLEYKSAWEDSTGFGVGSDISMWHRFTLTPGELEKIRAMATHKNAEFVSFTVRLPDDAFIEYEK